VYSLLDDMSSTARWRRVARTAARFTSPVTSVVRKLAPTRRGSEQLVEKESVEDSPALSSPEMAPAAPTEKKYPLPAGGGE
jgi:hypothetical protein